MDAPIRYLDVAGTAIAHRVLEGRGPTLLFLPGYASDMAGTKALALADWARAERRAALFLDYGGCGRSGGLFAEGTLSGWLAQARAVAALEPGPLVVVGSSMGGWLALLLALAEPGRVAGLVLVAPAPDFTQWSLADTLTAEERASLARTGAFTRPSAYGPEPTLFTRALIEDGAQHLLLARPVPVEVPVRILHGQADADVPWRLSLELAEKLASDDVQVELVKDGDHRLSRPQDLRLLIQALCSLID